MSILRKNNFSSTSSCCWRAALALIFTAPRLLANTPPCHPVRVSSNAIVGFGSGRTANLPRTPLCMNFAAPCFLTDRPTHLPVSISVSTVIRIGRPDGCHRNWCNRHHRWLWNHNRRWGRRWTAQMVNLAAPCLFACTPLLHCIDCTIVGVTCWHRTCWAWPGGRWWPWWRWSWWWCWWWRRRSSRRCLRERRGGTPNTCSHAAILLLFIRPQHLPIGNTLAAVEGQGCGEQTRQQPPEEQQQQWKETACRDDTGEIPPRPHDIEITSTTNILVRGLLDVRALAISNVGKATSSAASPTSNSTGGALSTSSTCTQSTGYSWAAAHMHSDHCFHLLCTKN